MWIKIGVRVNVLPGSGDYLGTPTYVVTSVADTFNHADDLEALSLREAVDLANNASTPAEIWLPAWRFQLTRDRGSNATDIDVAYGDLDVKKSMTIRGVADRTHVEWKPGIVDKVFDLLGDGNNDGQADYNSVSSADYTIWQDQNGSTGALEQFSADRNYVNDEPASVLVSSHVLGDRERVADDVVILRNGRVALHESLETLRDEAREITLSYGEPCPAWLAQVTLLAKTSDGNSHVRWFRCPPAGQDSSAHEIDLHPNVRRVNLESLYLALTQHALSTRPPAVATSEV